jgi:hypothetical protein
MPRFSVSLQSLVLVMAASLACNGDSLTTPPTKGTLNVTTTTSGGEPDLDGYTVQIDAEPVQTVGVSAIRTDVIPGSHTVQLGDVAPNCAVAENPRTVSVAAGETETVTFAVTCSATAGSIQITTATTGSSLDPDGYALSVDDGTAQPIGINAKRTAGGLEPGPHTVELSGVADNCGGVGDNPTTATVIAGKTATVIFAVTCSDPVGGIQITTTTTGPSLDADGYALSVDFKASQPIGINAVLTIAGLPPGPHTLMVSGIANNCGVVGNNPVTTMVTASVQLEVAFTLECPSPGLRWQAMHTGTDFGFSGIWGSSPIDVYAVGQSEQNGVVVILHYNGQTWSRQADAQGVVPGGVWGTAANDVFVVGGDVNHDTGALHYDGEGWSKMGGLGLGSPGGPEQYPIWASFSSVWSTSKADAFAVGSTYSAGRSRPLAAHFDGTSWSRMTLPGDDYVLADVFGLSSDNVYAVGTTTHGPRSVGVIVHYDGFQWTWAADDNYPWQFSFSGIWANSPNDVFAVGHVADFDGSVFFGGAVFHYDGSSWSIMAILPTRTLLDVWGTSGSDVFAVGYDAILHYDGKAWIKVADQGGHAVWGSSPTDVFVVGSGGIILHGTP